jgi:hypothetical protein
MNANSVWTTSSGRARVINEVRGSYEQYKVQANLRAIIPANYLVAGGALESPWSAFQTDASPSQLSSHMATIPRFNPPNLVPAGRLELPISRFVAEYPDPIERRGQNW